MTNEIETEAREMGWVPKEEFRGDESKWRPADEYVERGKTVLPILKKNLSRQSDQISEMQSTIKDMYEHFQKAEQVAQRRGYDLAYKELNEKQERAVEEGDVETFKALKKEEQDLKREEQAKRKETTSAPAKKDTAPSQAFQAWNEKNPWYNGDEATDDMSTYARSVAAGITKNSPGLPEHLFYEEIEMKVKKRFPDKFQTTNPNRDRASRVDGGGKVIRGDKGRTFADLPQSAKDACKRFQKQLKALGKDFTEEDYLKNYSWD
jgi:hypothetical protein